MNDILSMVLGKPEHPSVVEAPDKGLLRSITFILLADNAKVLQTKMLLDWWKSNFKKNEKFKKKN